MDELNKMIENGPCPNCKMFPAKCCSEISSLTQELTESKEREEKLKEKNKRLVEALINDVECICLGKGSMAYGKCEFHNLLRDVGEREG